MEGKFRNNPTMSDAAGNRTIREYEHQELTINFHGSQCSIHKNGRVTITTSTLDKENDEVVVDEVNVPASLIFKLAGLLKDTRTVKYIAVTETEKTEPLTEKAEQPKVG